MNLSNIFKASQVAEKLNLHEHTIRRRAKALGIEMVKVGSAFVFTADDVARIAAYSETELPQPEPTPNIDGLLTSKQAAGQVSAGMSAASFVRRAREIGLFPVLVLEKAREKAYWTVEQVNRFKNEYDPFLKLQQVKPKQKGVAPFASQQIKVQAESGEQYTDTRITVVTDGKEATARYLKLTNAAKPFNVASLWS